MVLWISCSSTQHVTLRKTTITKPIRTVAQVPAQGSSAEMNLHLEGALTKEGVSMTRCGRSARHSTAQHSACSYGASQGHGDTSGRVHSGGLIALNLQFAMAATGRKAPRIHTVGRLRSLMIVRLPRARETATVKTRSRPSELRRSHEQVRTLQDFGT
jgi:hypothetical protein